jgi:hypothetical protein
MDLNERVAQATNDPVGSLPSLFYFGVGRAAKLAGGQVKYYSTVAREVAGQLRDRDEPQAAELAETVAARSSAVADYLTTNDGRKLVGDAQNATRGYEWLMAGAGVVGGFLLMRTIRTSAD